MSILALDLAGERVGYAVLAAGEVVAAGTWDLSGADEPGRCRGVRWRRLLEKLERVVKANSLELASLIVAYEVVTFASPGGWKTAQRWGAAEGILELWLALKKIEEKRVRRVHVADVKSVAVGKGSGKGTDKKWILRAARTRWPMIEFIDDNAADAAFVGAAAALGMPAARAAAKKGKNARPPRPKRPRAGKQLALTGA